jgi:hypothetical protein
MDKQKVNKETHFVIRASQEFKDKFNSFCKKNNYVPTKRIRALIEMDMNKKK